MGYSDHQVRPKARESAERDAFDRWLRRSLRQAHDDIMAEPVPDTLLAILGQASPQAGPGGPPTGDGSSMPDDGAADFPVSQAGGSRRQTSGSEA